MPGSGSDQNVTQMPNASPDSFGAVQAQELGQVGAAGLSTGRDLINAGAQQQDMVNRAKVRDILSQAQNASFDYVTDNVLSKKGNEAIGLQQPTQDMLKQIQGTYSSSLDNPAQKQLFNQLFPEVYNHADNLTRRHIAEQTQVYNQETLTASKGAAVNAAMVDYNNPAAIQEAETTIVADNNALHAGFPAEQQYANQQEISKLHSDIASTMASNNPAAAAVYIRQNQAKILPDQFKTLSQTINNQLVTTAANKSASTLSQLDPTTALATANKIEDPEQRQLTIDALNTHFSAKTSTDALNAANADATNVTTILADPTMRGGISPGVSSAHATHRSFAGGE